MRTCLRVVTVPAISGFRCAGESAASLCRARGAPFLRSPSAPPPPRQLWASGRLVRGWDPPAQVRRAGTASELSRFPRLHSSTHPPPPLRAVRPLGGHSAEFARLLLSLPRVPGRFPSFTGAPVRGLALRFPSPSARSVLSLAVRILNLAAPVRSGGGGLGLPPSKACCLSR